MRERVTGDRVKAILTAAELGPRDAAALLGVSRQAIHAQMRGGASGSSATLMRLLEADAEVTIRTLRQINGG